MRLIKRLFMVLVVFLLALVLGAFLLPRNVEVSRTASIAAPPEVIFPHVNSMQATEAWSPWLSRDPQTELVYSGPESGVGNKMEWSSEVPEVGTGSQLITSSLANERVETALDFGSMGTAEAYFDMAKAGQGTDVTWGFVTDTGYNPIARWMGLMMDSWVGADYERGLDNIKALVEQND